MRFSHYPNRAMFVPVPADVLVICRSCTNARVPVAEVLVSM